MLSETICASPLVDELELVTEMVAREEQVTKLQRLRRIAAALGEPNLRRTSPGRLTQWRRRARLRVA